MRPQTVGGRAAAGWPARVFHEGRFLAADLETAGDGSILGIRPRKGALEESRSSDGPADSPGPILIPGFVNGHSHAFQRVLRGYVEGRGGDFWSWRERMYHAALELDPDDVRTASRAAFLEMVLAGFTGVIEFHYLHHGPLGQPYAEPNELAFAVLDAAAEVGIRICLLPTAYARAGSGFSPDPAQNRFIDASLDVFLRRVDDLRSWMESRHPAGDRSRSGPGEPPPEGARTREDARLVATRPPMATFGLALHSVRALPREWLEELARWSAPHAFPVHMHVAEQPAEVEACLAEHGRRPVELLDELGLLGRRFTAVHAIHLTEGEIGMLGGSGICACPSTEANLADGFIPAARLLETGAALCLGTDSHALVDPFAEMRELDYRERLRSGSRRGVAPAARLLESATTGGAERAGWDRIAVESALDLVVLDESDAALSGADPGSLVEDLALAGSPRLVGDVQVGGRLVVAGGRHERAEEIRRDFNALQRRLWKGA